MQSHNSFSHDKHLSHHALVHTHNGLKPERQLFQQKGEDGSYRRPFLALVLVNLYVKMEKTEATCGCNNKTLTKMFYKVLRGESLHQGSRRCRYMKNCTKITRSQSAFSICTQMSFCTKEWRLGICHGPTLFGMWAKYKHSMFSVYVYYVSLPKCHVCPLWLFDCSNAVTQAHHHKRQEWAWPTLNDSWCFLKYFDLKICVT